MRKKEYPLEPVARVRGLKVDDAAKKLADAARAREDAQRAKAEAEKRRDEAEAAARVVNGVERDALEHGSLRAGDLARADAWELRAAMERAELARTASLAGEHERAAQARETSARGDVAARKQEAEVVEKDRAKWTERERKVAAAKEEEAADEAWRPRE